MADLSVVYTNLMPYSANVKELWEAEKAIRRQHAEDQRHARSRWRRLEPRCLLLSNVGMSESDKVEFGIDMQVGL